MRGAALAGWLLLAPLTGRADEAAQPPSAHYAAARRLEETDQDAARAHYQQACTAAHPDACYRLGLLLLLVGEDLQGAIDAFAAACDQGDLSGCVSMGLIGASGVAGGAPDPAVLFSEACRQGDAQGCLWWGQTLSGQPADAALARACALGSAEGCWQRLQRRPDSLPPLSPQEAADLRARACSGGIQEACTPGTESN